MAACTLAYPRVRLVESLFRTIRGSVQNQLDAPAWTTIATNLSIGTLTYFTETNVIRMGQPQGFYRITPLP